MQHGGCSLLDDHQIEAADGGEPPATRGRFPSVLLPPPPGVGQQSDHTGAKETNSSRFGDRRSTQGEYAGGCVAGHAAEGDAGDALAGVDARNVEFVDLGAIARIESQLPGPPTARWLHAAA